MHLQTAIRILQELLRELVHDAHTLGLKVVLDVLLGLVGKDGAWTGLGRVEMVGLDSDFGDFPNKVQTVGVFPVVYLSTHVSTNLRSATYIIPKPQEDQPRFNPAIMDSYQFCFPLYT